MAASNCVRDSVAIPDADCISQAGSMSPKSLDSKTANCLAGKHIAVVIPCYRVRGQILKVLSELPDYVSKVYVIADCCPEQSGKLVKEEVSDSRVEVLFNAVNSGVGGAVIVGYRKALSDGMDYVVKIDGDGQMDAGFILRFLRPLLREEADYTKGNRFYNLESLSSMPLLRLFGNAMLSFVNKAVSGYWNVMDPTNGFTAISRSSLSRLPLEKLDQRYFFESDMLFRLGTLRAVVRDIPMDAIYEQENSSLHIGRTLVEFPPKYLARALKRLFYNYLLRDFSVVSISISFGILLVLTGSILGVVSWANNAAAGTFASTGTVMLATLPILIGVQLLMIALVLDILNVPKDPLSRDVEDNL